MNGILTMEQEWTRVNPGKPHILRYMREALDVSELNWQDLTTSNLNTIAEYITNVVCGNSAATYFAIIKAFLARYKDDDIIPCKSPEKVLRAKKEPQQNVSLTMDEISRIESYYDQLISRQGKQEEKDVLTLFLLEVYCGARSCDIEKLSELNIKDGKLTYISQKTHILATMPAHHRLVELLSRIPKRSYQPAVKNRTIKRVAMKCHIDAPITIFYRGKMQTRPKYEYLGTHSARRSFASILASKGVQREEISQYMSHTNAIMTERYIVVDTQQVSAAAMSFFNG